MMSKFLQQQLMDGTKCRGCGQYTNGGAKGPGWIIYCIWCLIYREETGQSIPRGSDARKLKKYHTDDERANKRNRKN